MKLKAAITEGAPQGIIDAMGSRDFAQAVLEQVCGTVLGVEDPVDGPAEYYVQKPDETVAIEDDQFGVELRLTGVSQAGRTPRQFHDALRELHRLARDSIVEALSGDSAGEAASCRVQLFTVMMLDGDVETAPGSGTYSNVLEHPAEWVEPPHNG